MSSDGSPPAISSVVRQTLRKYGDTLKDKLIMQTYDGESVMSSSISGLQRFFVRTPFCLLSPLCCSSIEVCLMPVSFIYSSEGIFANFSAFSQECAGWGRGGATPTNIFNCAKKLIKRQPCWKRVGNSNFCDLIFLSDNSWSIGQNTPPLQQVSWHITAFSSFTRMSSK